jgi:type IV secretory pathway VirB10-like protein
MQERPQNFEEVTDDPEVTLATPRFDADEARSAHPVVPLSEADAHARRTRFRDGARRHLPLTLLALALLSAVTFGGILALRRSHANAPVSDAAAQDGQPTQTNTTPPQSAPAQTGVAPAQTDAANAQENPTAQTPSAPAPNAADEEKRSEQKTEDRAAARAREDRAAHTQRGEESLAQPLASRAGRREVGGEDLERRGHLRDRDGRDEDRDEKEARKDSRHAKKGEARLVDVLVGRPRP